jgi:hypothetical protein
MLAKTHEPAAGPQPSEGSTEALSLDKLFKTLIQVFFRDTVELLHPELAEALDFGKVVFIAEPAFADFRKQGQVEPDVVAQVETRLGDPKVALVHIETEARFSSDMARRMRRYQLQLELKYDQPVMAAVIYLKGGSAGVEACEVTREVGPWKCGSSRYLSFGVAGSLTEEWVARPQRLAAALAALMSSKLWDPVQKKLACLRAITGEPNEDHRFLLNKLIDEALQLKGEERARFEAALDSVAEVKTMVATWKEALAESEARGEARGKVEATREAIELMVRHRFGSVSDRVKERLAAISELSRLYELLEAIADARSSVQVDAALGLRPAGA